MSTTIDKTNGFAERALVGNWRISLRRYSGSVVVEVERQFEANDVSAYQRAEFEANDLVMRAPATQPGTVWGTDSGSVGGHAGLTGGYMRLCKSGVSIRWAKAVAKELGLTITER